eukprot:TRINITY_DN400_c0_g2_i1.p1 TRINITY_DN400_c0_g2~~TRINITY_DN400_c0_g2_i1.p1  ORF type:complete len:747 (-),score=194.17 TRINITY_DN400_c0_g2_i1:483-2723(-)
MNCIDSKLMEEKEKEKEKEKDDLLSGLVIPDRIKDLSSVDLINFFKERATEVEELCRFVKTTSSSKRLFQTLPRHVRRRAMSHNIHLLPRRMRRAAAHEMASCERQLLQQQQQQQQLEDKGKKPSNRKKRRRPGDLAQDHAKRSDASGKWLETHIWHAKRMHMCPMWGYKLAVQNTAKGARSSYHAMRYGSTLYDASYYEVVELCGTKDDIAFVVGTKRVLFFEDGSIEGEALLRYIEDDRNILEGHEESKGKKVGHSIGLVSFLWKPQLQKRRHDDDSVDGVRLLWIFVHPSISAEVMRIFEARRMEIDRLRSSSLSLTHRVQEMCRFEIRGSRASELVALVVRQQQAKSESEELELESESREEQDERREGENERIGSVRIPRQWDLISSLSVMELVGSGCIIAVDNAKDPRLLERKDLMPSLLHRCCKRKDMEEVLMRRVRHPWKPDMAQSTLWDQSTRVTFQQEAMTDAHVHKYRKRRRVMAGLPPRHATGTDTSAECQDLACRPIPVTLIRKKGGWDVIVPSGCGLAFWRPLASKCGHTLSLEDRRRCIVESGGICFPEDFPDCDPGLKHLQCVIGIAERKFSIFPHAKEMLDLSTGYGKGISILEEVDRVTTPSFPLLVKDFQYHAMMRVEVDMAGRGEPYPGFPILHPHSKKVIGFFTNGVFSFRRGRGFGVGFVECEAWNDLDVRGLSSARSKKLGLMADHHDIGKSSSPRIACMPIGSKDPPRDIVLKPAPYLYQRAC